MRCCACTAAAVPPTSTAPGSFVCNNAASASNRSQPGGCRALGMLDVRLLAAQKLGQQCGKGTDLGVIPIQGRRHLLYAIDEGTLPAGANCSNQSSPGCNITANDDIFNSGFGEVTAGRLREMPVLHQRGL